MAFSKITTRGITGDTLEAGDIAANAVGASELADDAVDTAAIADNAVTNAKIPNDLIQVKPHIKPGKLEPAVDGMLMGNDVPVIKDHSPSKHTLYQHSKVVNDKNNVKNGKRNSVSEMSISTPNVHISPNSGNQETYVSTIRNKVLTFGIGPAGTGKTYLAVACAVDALYKKRVRRIILARPAVEAGENLGFLPGDLQEKVDPYLRPLYDALEDMMPSDRMRRALADSTIEIAPLAYMRGRTLSDAFVILDEAQNATTAQMKMFLTRLGLNSQVVITGDKTQIDLPSRDHSGLLEVERILSDIDGISLVYMDSKDVIRHRLVKDIIKAYAQSPREIKGSDK